jgi:hypothetical protein
MTHEQAIARCAELNADETRTQEWFSRKVGPDDWEIVSIAMSGFSPTKPWKTTTEARPAPQESPDPRPSIFRNIPPFGAG